SANSDWQDCEVTALIPAPGQPTWKPWMTEAWLRVDCHGETGQVWIDDVSIHQAEPLSGWASWQAEGWDHHGLVADPLFYDISKDDFRLQPQSPAVTKLGFHPLPIEKMGLIIDEWRTSLPPR
ncbi:MAG: hypothetical protein ACOYMN_12945, partial [Roseimicrobium sp.]